jgi:hypothetical protein
MPGMSSTREDRSEDVSGFEKQVRNLSHAESRVAGWSL